MRDSIELVDLRWERNDQPHDDALHGDWYYVTARTRDGKKYAMDACLSDEIIADEAMCREVLAAHMISDITKVIA